jgi:hypothetical protein
MSILEGNINPYVWPHDTFQGPTHPCFYCGHEVGEGLVVHWHGHLEDDLYLHSDCVPGFTQGLLQHWHAIQHREHPYRHRVFDLAEQREHIKNLCDGYEPQRHA